MALQHLRSSTADKRPTPAAMSDGQLALNTNLVSPGLFFKDSNGDSVKVGPVHVGTTAPNVTPGAGGQAGNSKGEQWLDTSSSRYVFKIWDGTAWRTEDGEFVNASGDTMTGALVMDNQQQVQFRETTANGTNSIALQAPAAVASDRTLTLPDVTGTIVSTGDTGTVTSTMILDGTIVNADINASAAIALSKLATGALPSGITVASTNIVNETIVNADINASAAIDLSKLATGALPSGITIASTNIVDGTIVNADINASAAIDLSKLATGALPSGITIASTNIVDGTIVNADINASADIADTKLATISTAGKVSGTAITSGNINTSGEFQITNISPTVRLTESDGTATHSQTVIARTDNLFQLQTRSSTGVFLSTDYLSPTNASGATDHIWRIANTEKARLTSTGLKILAADTAADPGYAWQGDEDTGMFRTGANSLGFAAGGLEVLRVNRAGGGGGTTRQIEFSGAGVISTTAGNLTITPESTLALEPQTGVVRSVVIYSSTTASAANIFVGSNGNISRSTSSIKYKTEIEDAELSYSEALVYGSRPVWYRSLSESDPSEYSYWGFIAEEVAEIDPRMVHWGDDGPEGVQYDRYVVHLVSVIQKQQQRLDALEARIAALEA
jgi:hypothetical protein